MWLKPKPPEARIMKEGAEGDMDKVTREKVEAKGAPGAIGVKEEDKTITEKIPQDLLRAINEAKNKIGNLSNQLNQIGLGILRAQKQQSLLFDKLENAGVNYSNKIQYASQKMKLTKKKQYKSWQFNGESFIGEKIQNEEKEIKVKPEHMDSVNKGAALKTK